MRPWMVFCVSVCSDPKAFTLIDTDLINNSESLISLLFTNDASSTHGMACAIMIKSFRSI